MTEPKESAPEEQYEYVEVSTGRKVSVQEILDITDVIQRIRKATGWGFREYIALILALGCGSAITALYFMWMQTLVLLAQIGGMP
jgi:Na+-transporting methylmalonyl-CoA/oxaloacetate decarboxylase beta subunit